MEARPLRRCRYCQEQFRGRKNALTCSSACRTARSRLRKEGPRSEFRAREHGLEASDLWRTDPADFVPVAGEFGIVLDAAAEAEDALCSRFITPEQDGLTSDWIELAGPALPGFRWPGVWCQPPYSRRGGGLDRWTSKARDESERGLVAVMLIPPHMGATYMQIAHRWADEIRVYPQRRAFICPDTGELRKGNRYDSCLVIFRPERFSGAGKARPDARAQISYIDSEVSPTRAPRSVFQRASELESRGRWLLAEGASLRRSTNAPEGLRYDRHVWAQAAYSGALARIHGVELTERFAFEGEGIRAGQAFGTELEAIREGLRAYVEAPYPAFVTS